MIFRMMMLSYFVSDLLSNKDILNIARIMCSVEAFQ